MQMHFINLDNNDETEVKYDKEVGLDFTTNLFEWMPNFATQNYQPEFQDFSTTEGVGTCANRPSNQYASPVSLPICRKFWKAGDYDAGLPIQSVSQNVQNRLRVHPKFLHSNATSHKWAFGAIAELLDNAVDEVQNGATFVVVDKITNPRNGNPALLVHDDGGGMGPESLRHCMSFGFSNKQSNSSIGQYGNGFKTSTMRLGADVIVFSRCMGERSITQSIGLLSYTFLRQTGYDDIVVPMVDYEINLLTGGLQRLIQHGERQFHSNLSTLLQWSPFTTEAELLKQFSDMGFHGTKVIVFNLWFNDDGDMELDFHTDAQDIRISGAPEVLKKKKISKMSTNEYHIANTFHYSLRVYSSFLYLHLPENFKIFLRGQVVDPHHIVSDLRFVECIKYKPQITEVEADKEPAIYTTIGFLEGAPNVSAHGFNIYCKNRLILPFWPVCGEATLKCRGVAGVLEVNFLKPTHNKQDFEKSNIFQKLEIRLRLMAMEYWYYHCHLVGYVNRKKKLCSFGVTSHQMLHNENQEAVLSLQQLPIPVSQLSQGNPPQLSTPACSSPGHITNLTANSQAVSQLPEMNPPQLSTPACLSPGHITNFSANSQAELPMKRRHENHITTTGSFKKPASDREIAGGGHRRNQKNQVEHRSRRVTGMLSKMVLANKKLHTQCVEYEKKQGHLLKKVETLKEELVTLQLTHTALLLELKIMDEAKVEKG